jgi:hypothetical protein
MPSPYHPQQLHNLGTNLISRVSSDYRIVSAEPAVAQKIVVELLSASNLVYKKVHFDVDGVVKYT